MTGHRRDRYEESIAEFRAFVQRAVPASATVAVVSKGDHELLILEDRRGWHFPQRADGVYAGYYPSNSANAIAHLEAVRSKGADFIAFPMAALWWLEKYPEFGAHLQGRYHEIARDGEAGTIFALSDRAESSPEDVVEPQRGNGTREETDAGPLRGASRPVRHPTAGSTASADVGAELLEDLRKVFDPLHYSKQFDADFASADDALAHYLKAGASAADPHPLFDTGWYLTRSPEVRISGESPLIHFLKRGHTDELDPNPYFDTSHYYSQKPTLREERRNALVHYIENAPAKNAAHPNPFFHDSFYLAAYRNVDSEASTPLEHFLMRGCDQGRFGSPLHRSIMLAAQRPSASLLRGRWRKGTALFFTSGERLAGQAVVTALANQLGEQHHVGSLVIACRGAGDADSPGRSPAVVLEDYELADQVLRPAAVRFLARSLAGLGPAWAVSDVTDVLEPLAASGVPAFYALPEVEELPSQATLEAAFEAAHRVLVPSSRALRATSERLGHRPPNGALTHLGKAPYAEALSELAATAPGVGHAGARSRRARSNAKPKIVIPCSDWAVSGVNVALEAVGRQLVERGWGVEIVFTRREETVLETMGDDHLPTLPYRYLQRGKIGVLGMWEELIAELESSAPSILFMSYDFLANSIAPALSEEVGVVAWAQADDGDYYEQAYRLGPYCNAVVCVSELIKERVSALNPVIGERAQVIHNSSVSRHDIARRRPPRSAVMRLAYSGRLVQYQKRVLDFVGLARALDKTGVPYEISLIGTFSRYEKAEEPFRRLAKKHLDDGRINLRGRMTRPAVLEQLTSHDFFVLLSDFEGLPLSLGEAMARGCVPIAAESPSGIPELIDSGRNGLIVGGRDYDEWAKLLVQLWQDRRRYSLMSRRARATVRDRFSVEHLGRQWAELFERTARELAAGTFRRPPSLHWGERRSRTGDVLPPPSMHDPGGFNWV